jgi:hypothetical protein
MPIPYIYRICIKTLELPLLYIVSVHIFEGRTANDGPVRIQYKCLILIFALPEMKLRASLFPKQN